MGDSHGRFISLEGGEGVGKSTQARLLVERLRACGVAAIATREPGGSARAEKIREFILSGKAKHLGEFGEAALFYLARADHVQTLIKPALERGVWVICDRFFDSTHAYQGAAGGSDIAEIEALRRAAIGDFKPDLTLMLDLPAALGLARAQARAAGAEADRFEAEGLKFHEFLREAFLDIARKNPDRCLVIDAGQDVDAIAARIWSAVEARFGAEALGARADAGQGNA